MDNLTPSNLGNPSDKCVGCGLPIVGEETRIFTYTAGVIIPRHYPGSNVKTYEIRRHFLGPCGLLGR